MMRTRHRLLPLTLALLGMLHSATRAKDNQIKDTPDSRVAEAVLHSLLTSPLGKTMPPLKYRVLLLDKLVPNAFSQRNGSVYITVGLLPVFEGDRGVWAAVIGHELGHVLLAHPDALPHFQATLQQAYAKARTEGYNQGPAVWPNVHIGDGLKRYRSSKEQEYQADFVGMMLMAEAGYQPGYSVILERRLLFGLGSEPRVIAAFSHHPRMKLREERTRKFSDVAMDIFRLRWPDAAKSPGGNLPPYGTIGRWTLEQSDGGERLAFHVFFQVHRTRNMKIRVAAFFLDGDLRVRALDAAYRATDGSLVLNRFVSGAENKSADVSMQIPARELMTRHPRLLAVVFLMAGSRPLDIATRHVDLSRIAFRY